MIINKLYTTAKCLGLAYFMLALTACSDDFFDVEVGERITTDEHYEDKIDAEASFYGALISLQDVAANSILVDGLRSDQMVLNSNANADLLEIGSLNMRADNPFLDKSGYYRTIINVNEVLAHIQKAVDRDRDFLDGELFDMRATLYGLRAWCYLNVMRNFGEVNWMEDNLVELPEHLDGNKLSKPELLDTLINTFHADSVIFDRTVNGFTRQENVYPSFPNYKAVLGELYLEKGDYEKAIYYLKLGMETVPSGENAGTCYKVASYTELSWKNIFSGAENRIVENICVTPYNLSEDQANPVVQYFLPNNLYMVKPAQHLVDSMEMAIQLGITPDTADIYRGMGVTYDTITSGQYYINKYSIGSSDPYSSDIILQRAGDVHLLLAEALNRNGRSDVALMLLNSGIFGEDPLDRPGDFGYWTSNQGIRGRVRLAPREISDSIRAIISDIEEVEMIEDWIIQEKAMECAFEGKRMSDLIRVAERRDNPAEYLSSILARKYSDPAEQAMVKNYYMNRENWYLPN